MKCYLPTASQTAPLAKVGLSECFFTPTLGVIIYYLILKKVNLMETQIPMRQKTYIVASQEKDGPWSLAYVSQVYGTIFGIYTNFEISHEDQGFQCRTVNCKIGNFKGLIMLGIKDVTVQKVIDPETLKPMLLMDVYVKGLETRRDFRVDLSALDMVVEEGTKIKVQRHLIPMHDGQAEFGGLFDTEYYYRDAPNANVVDFEQHAEAFFAYKNGYPSEIRETSLSEYSPFCVESERFIKIE